MATFVVDVNVVVKWRLPEELATNAALLLSKDDIVLLAPDFLLIEANNVFATKVRSGSIARDAASSYLSTLPGLLELTPFGLLLGPAFEMSSRLNCSVYDALYVVLALEHGCKAVTADEKLVDKLKGAHSDALVWLGDITVDSL
jgi:predicted nucleic acid-binding protein